MKNITQMRRLARAIPAGIERKDAAPNALEALKAELLDNITKKLTGYRDEMERKVAEYKAAGVTSPEAEKAVDLLGKRIDGLELELRRPDAQLPGLFQEETPGQKFIASEEAKQFASRWQRGGCAVKFDTLDPFFGFSHELKTTITSSAVGSSTPGILIPQRIPGIVPKPERRLTIRDLIPVRPTQNNAVEYVQENAFTNAASPVVEANSKAESALTFTISYDNVRCIAHWIPASRQILDDFEGLRAFIDHKLLYGLKLKEETELLNGDNLGDHLNGLVTRATAYAGTYDVAADTRIDKLRRAILEAEVANEVVSGIVLNPVDWNRIETQKEEPNGANTGAYLVGNPRQLIEVPTLWGKPVVVSNSMTNGKFLIGAFSTQAQIFDRLQAAIDISTEHSDYFIKNLVAIRAEERLTLAVFRTTAFIYGSF